MRVLKALSFFTFVSFFILGLNLNSQAGSGIFQTYIVFDWNSGGNAFYAGGLNADASASYDEFAFGTPTSLTLNGGEVKTYKNSGSNVSGAAIFYRVYTAGSPSGAFTSINLPFDSNIGGAPFEEDQKWKEEFAGVDVLSGLSAGNYTLEVYWEAYSTDGTHFDTDFGNNFQGHFTVPAASPVPTMSEWGLIIFGLLLLCTGAVVVWRSTYQHQRSVA